MTYNTLISNNRSSSLTSPPHLIEFEYRNFTEGRINSPKRLPEPIIIRPGQQDYEKVFNHLKWDTLPTESESDCPHLGQPFKDHRALLVGYDSYTWDVIQQWNEDICQGSKDKIRVTVKKWGSVKIADDKKKEKEQKAQSLKLAQEGTVTVDRLVSGSSSSTNLVNNGSATVTSNSTVETGSIYDQNAVDGDFNNDQDDGNDYSDSDAQRVQSSKAEGLHQQLPLSDSTANVNSNHNESDHDIPFNLSKNPNTVIYNWAQSAFQHEVMLSIGFKEFDCAVVMFDTTLCHIKSAFIPDYPNSQSSTSQCFLQSAQQFSLDKGITPLNSKTTVKDALSLSGVVGRQRKVQNGDMIMMGCHVAPVFSQLEPIGHVCRYASGNPYIGKRQYKEGRMMKNFGLKILKKLVQEGKVQKIEKCGDRVLYSQSLTIQRIREELQIGRPQWFESESEMDKILIYGIFVPSKETCWFFSKKEHIAEVFCEDQNPNKKEESEDGDDNNHDANQKIASTAKKKPGPTRAQSMKQLQDRAQQLDDELIDAALIEIDFNPKTNGKSMPSPKENNEGVNEVINNFASGFARLEEQAVPAGAKSRRQIMSGLDPDGEFTLLPNLPEKHNRFNGAHNLTKSWNYVVMTHPDSSSDKTLETICFYRPNLPRSQYQQTNNKNQKSDEGEFPFGHQWMFYAGAIFQLSMQRNTASMVWVHCSNPSPLYHGTLPTFTAQVQEQQKVNCKHDGLGSALLIQENVLRTLEKPRKEWGLKTINNMKQKPEGTGKGKKKKGNSWKSDSKNQNQNELANLLNLYMASTSSELGVTQIENQKRTKAKASAKKLSKTDSYEPEKASISSINQYFKFHDNNKAQYTNDPASSVIDPDIQDQDYDQETSLKRRRMSQNHIDQKQLSEKSVSEDLESTDSALPLFQDDDNHNTAAIIANVNNCSQIDSQKLNPDSKNSSNSQHLPLNWENLSNLNNMNDNRCSNGTHNDNANCDSESDNQVQSNLPFLNSQDSDSNDNKVIVIIITDTSDEEQEKEEANEFRSETKSQLRTYANGQTY